MGMAASQCNFGMLTRRKHDIGRELERCSMQKTEQTREMKKVTQKYQNALNSKTLKWTNNSGVTYVDLSYATLMKPSPANQNKPYLITNTDGKIVIDDKYKEYAEMISPDGKPGGDWESNRVKILASLTGLSEEQINNNVAAKSASDAATKNYEQIREDYDKLRSDEPTVKNNSAKDFISKAGIVSGNDLGKLYSQSNGTVNLGDSASASSNLKTLLDGISNNLANYLNEDDQKALQDACNTYHTEFVKCLDFSAEQWKAYGGDFSKNGNNYSFNVQKMVHTLLGSYQIKGGSCGQNSSSGETTYTTRDKQTTEWQQWNEELTAKKAEMDAALAEQKTAVDNENQTLTAEQESSIAFYDQLFSAIAEKGWNYNPQVNDNDYLNNMLQNNQFYITTMESKTDDEDKAYYEYEQSLASNFDNIITVNDKDAQEEALVQYEYEKAIINEKETRIDTRMKNLETEQSAINNMLKGIETVRNDNIERNFSIEA